MPPQAVPGTAHDLRTFIHRLTDAGRLIRVEETVDWRFEIGERTRADRRPLLFERINDYPGQSVFANGLCDLSSIGLALGLEPGIPSGALLAESRKRLGKPIPPKIVPTPAFLDNELSGSGVDLTRFAVPQWSELDAGRYIGTWHVNISRDPETQARNVGVYRMQILNPTQATISASPNGGLMSHFAKAERAGNALPVVVAIGVPEAVVIAGGAACPAGIDEFDFAGALQQEAVELTVSDSTGLEFPARSEIVIEGFIHPGVRVQDGPYFDYCGVPNVNPKAVLFEASRILFRSNPIFRGSAIGTPGAEDHQLFAFLAQLDLVDFHGSRAKQAIQNVLWKSGHFRALQCMGRLGGFLRKRP
ncbi:MAG: UbiD family decarboxylase domain-containing protein [Terracidiphilus sp.]